MNSSYYDSDERVARIIREFRKEYYDEEIAGDESRKLTFHLSSLRRALLDSFLSGKGGNALEIGSGFGAMTGQLLDHFDNVDAIESDPVRKESLDLRYYNKIGLRICENITEALSLGRMYDLMLAVEEPDEDPWVMQLAGAAWKLSGRLKEDGVLLLGIRQTEGRALIKKMLKEAGFFYIREYYPLPDLAVTHEIYTNDKLPDISVMSRSAFFDPYGERTAASVRDEIAKNIDENTFAEKAPCVLLECRRFDAEGTAKYISVSLDRKKEHASSVVIRTNGTTEKTPLYPEGDEHIGQQVENLNALKLRGINTVPATLKGMMRGQGELSGRFMMNMLTIGLPSLLDTLRKSTASGKDAVLWLMDNLWRDILMSSDWDRSLPETEAVLDKAYIDMIPANAFYEEGAGRITYIDQEFVKYDTPASFVMYRAVRYTWEQIPELQDVISSDEMMARYGITEAKAAVYKEQEDAFTFKVRNCELYSQIFGWASDREYIPDLHDDHEKIRAVQMDLLREFDRICEENGLKYCAVFGTLLGAVRDKGMVPWDDDIDLAMPRSHFDKLTQIAPSAFEHPYFLQTAESDTECFYGGYAKLRNSNTTALEWFNKGKKCNQGIWIDIFPLDDCASTFDVMKEQQRKVYFRQRMIYAKRYPLWADRMIDSDPKKLSLYYILASKMSDKTLCNNLHKACTRYPLHGYLTIFACYYSWRGNRNLFKAEDIDELIRVPFGDMTIPVTSNYREWLENRYGRTFMARPPFEERKPHHSAEYDPERPYKTYIAREAESDLNNGREEI